jgi:hypothetical protein
VDEIDKEHPPGHVDGGREQLHPDLLLHIVIGRHVQAPRTRHLTYTARAVNSYDHDDDDAAAGDNDETDEDDGV